jgi:hypothetical protein
VCKSTSSLGIVACRRQAGHDCLSLLAPTGTFTDWTFPKRRKKIKCDGKQPCTHCSVYSYGMLMSCHFTPLLTIVN